MQTRHFDQLPKAYLAYPKVVQGLVQQQIEQRVQKKPRPAAVLPQVEYVVDSLKIDSEHLKKYQQICHFAQDHTVPAMYLAVLAQSLQMHMMTNELFPFALLGLVHIANQIKQYRVMHSSEVFELSCRFGDLTPHEKGLQFDFIVTAKVAGETVFEGKTTYLSRGKSNQTTAVKSNDGKVLDLKQKTSWQVEENLGRRYALISGDFNFIHLHAVPAKLFGFNRAIAHGMWSKARTLAALSPLPAAYEADVAFKLPMFLPSQVSLMTAEDGKNTDFVLQNSNNQKPHLAGKLLAL
ncbi:MULTISPECIES: MaoC family dehydratase [unclassified Acinetobacter]|uniref:MaoC family dehydratase n=1 Tax=unclassified Acinetobacter TaxID=196816 RepID=UPI0035B71926